MSGKVGPRVRVTSVVASGKKWAVLSLKHSVHLRSGKPPAAQQAPSLCQQEGSPAGHHGPASPGQTARCGRSGGSRGLPQSSWAGRHSRPLETVGLVRKGQEGQPSPRQPRWASVSEAQARACSQGRASHPLSTTQGQGQGQSHPLEPGLQAPSSLDTSVAPLPDPQPQNSTLPHVHVPTPTPPSSCPPLGTAREHTR